MIYFSFFNQNFYYILLIFLILNFSKMLLNDIARSSLSLLAHGIQMKRYLKKYLLAKKLLGK